MPGSVGRARGEAMVGTADGDRVARTVARVLTVLVGLVVLGVAAVVGEVALGVAGALIAAVLVLGALWIRSE